ncbi:CIS tube protein [Spirochaeta cellobiosiphila]|uniref:CIS tube protein n=1 Tax=Spirochaeta cellobiosiphila TaxID=504483 RepID=UPI00040ECA29|nr:LysM peptidoglycan-binding domain-containing protein [Spirochaeta cellobiosiphila]
MALEKAVIINLDTDDEIPVLFNPKEYIVEKRTPWKEHEIHGLDSPAVEFTIGERKRLSMELFFDTSEDKTDVREYTDKIEELMLVNSDEHRPPFLLFSWGELKFKCVLEDLVQRFTMFLNDGTPIRAIVKVMFKEYSSAASQIKEKPRHSADHTKQMVLREGETLTSMASREYNNPACWRDIAEANNIEDPMNVEPGTVLKLPPLY